MGLIKGSKPGQKLGMLGTVMDRVLASMRQSYDFDFLRREFSVELAQLKEMGVATAANEEFCLKELYKHNGDVGSAMEFISKK